MNPLPCSSRKPQLRLWSLFLISLGLHGAVLWLLTPTMPAPQSRNLEAVQLTDLVAPQVEDRPSPQPQPASISTPASPDPGAITPDRPIAQPTPIATPPSPHPQPARSPQPIDRATPSSTPQPTPSATPTAKPVAPDTPEVLSQLIATQGLDSEIATRPDPNLFTQPALFFDGLPLRSRPKLKSDILRTVWIQGKIPDQVSVEVLSQVQRSNSQTSEHGNFGSGTVYEVKQGALVWYFNLVPTKDGTGTVIVVWKRDPSIHVQ